MAKSDNAASKVIYSGFIAQEVEAAANKLNFDFSGVDKPQTKDGFTACDMTTLFDAPCKGGAGTFRSRMIKIPK